MENHIRSVLTHMDVVFTDDVVAALAERVKRYPDIRRPLNLAHVIARNWALGQKRKVASRAKRAAAQTVKAAEAEIARVRREAALLEFESIVPRFIDARPYMPNALLYMRMICIEDKKDAECAHLFPGTTRDQRYQWLRRARDLVLPHVSPELRLILWKSIGTKRKTEFPPSP